LDQTIVALEFVSANQDEFKRLGDFAAEKLLVNFGLAKHQIADQAQYFPPELLLAMGRFHIELVFAAVDIEKS
jgi:hypothetical protein